MTLPNELVGHGTIDELLNKLHLSINDLDSKIGG